MVWSDSRSIFRCLLRLEGRTPRTGQRSNHRGDTFLTGYVQRFSSVRRPAKVVRTRSGAAGWRAPCRAGGERSWSTWIRTTLPIPPPSRWIPEWPARVLQRRRAAASSTSVSAAWPPTGSSMRAHSSRSRRGEAGRASGPAPSSKRSCSGRRGPSPGSGGAARSHRRNLPNPPRVATRCRSSPKPSRPQSTPLVGPSARCRRSTTRTSPPGSPRSLPTCGSSKRSWRARRGSVASHRPC